MARVKLFLKRPNSDSETAIRAVISDGRGKQIKVYSGISVKPKHWSQKNQNVLSANKAAIELNETLRIFKDKVLATYQKHKQAGIQSTPKLILSEVYPKQEKQLTFKEIYAEFLYSKKTTTKSEKYSKYDTLAKHLDSFESTRKPLEMDSFDQFLLEDFQNFLLADVKLNNQTVNKYFGFLRAFLNWSVSRAYLTDTSFRLFKPVSQPETLKIILTENDIHKLENVELGNKNYLRNVRELLILSCETGLRYSDYTRISQQHLKLNNEGVYYLQIRQEKTDDLLEIPMSDRALSIANKLISREVTPITNQKMNVYAKELGMMAGIDDPFEKTTFRGKEKNRVIKKKYELITTHTGRRTFATRLLQNGMQPKSVMRFTGHKDYKSFAKYINIPREDENEAVLKALRRPSFKVTKSIA